MSLQIYPTFPSDGKAPKYYLVYYPQRSFQPSSDCSLAAGKSTIPVDYQDSDMQNQPHFAMPLSMVHEQKPLFYTIDANGNYVILNGSAQQFEVFSPTLSPNQSDVSSNESFHQMNYSLTSTSDGTIASQPSESKSNRSGSSKRSGGNKSCGEMSRKSSGGSKPRHSFSSTYKTQLCNMFSTNGVCSYGSSCQYAHGHEEVRPILPHPKYKTQLCNKFNSPRGCQYGEKCHFRHPTDSIAAAASAVNIESQ